MSQLVPSIREEAHSMSTPENYSQQLSRLNFEAVFSRFRMLQSTGILNATPYTVYMIMRALRRGYDTLLSRAYARWWGIHLGSDSDFRGLPLFRRHPLSTITIGDHCRIQSSDWFNRMGGSRRCCLTTLRNASIIIGHHTGLSSTVVYCAERIEIGNHVLCGTRTTILDTDGHPLNPEDRADGGYGNSAPVIIEDDVLLGQNVLVQKGVRIGRGAIVSSNSVVTKSIPPNAIAAGVPARVVKARTDLPSEC